MSLAVPISAPDAEAFKHVRRASSSSSSSTDPSPSKTNFSSRPFQPTSEELEEINTRLQDASPQEILRWSIENIPNLYQTTAFGLTGLAATDMISKLSQQGLTPANKTRTTGHAIPLIFLDTLYHFQETLDLAERVRRRYGAELIVYKPPEVETVAEFEQRYGKELWIKDETTYDYLVKVEPARRAYYELGVAAVITGRRRSQGGERSNMPPIEIETGTGLIKVNPLASWTFAETKAYIDEQQVPVNALLNQGYSSVGDWHSTKPRSTKGTTSDADERAGRWTGRTDKTECGLHQDYFKMRMAFLKKQREAEQQKRDEERDEQTQT